MLRNWRVYTRQTATSNWKDTGIIESNRDVAKQIWEGIQQRLRFYEFKLEPITYGIAIDRSN